MKILTDCDGVILNWEEAFHKWMIDNGFERNDGHRDKYHLSHQYDMSGGEISLLIREFNDSSNIGFLKPFRDALDILPTLDATFTVITSLSKNKYSQYLRIRNIQNVFPDVVFDDFLFLDTGEKKTKVLKEFSGTNYYWIEDKFENALEGHQLGLKSILMLHDHNSEKAKKSNMLYAENWFEIRDIIRNNV